MREWPWIVPAASEDFYLVVNDFGRLGTAFGRLISTAPTMKPPSPI